MATFKIMQNGLVVASGSGVDKGAIMAEAMHYGLIYSQDGETKVFVNGKEIATMLRCREVTTENKC